MYDAKTLTYKQLNKIRNRLNPYFISRIVDVKLRQAARRLYSRVIPDWATAIEERPTSTFVPQEDDSEFAAAHETAIHTYGSNYPFPYPVEKALQKLREEEEEAERQQNREAITATPVCEVPEEEGDGDSLGSSEEDEEEDYFLSSEEEEYEQHAM